MPMHSNLKKGYSGARNMYSILVSHDFRYAGNERILYFRTREERREFIDAYEPPLPTPSPPAPSINGDEEATDNGDNGEPTPPAMKASYGILLLVCLLAGLAYFLWR